MSLIERARAWIAIDPDPRAIERRWKSASPKASISAPPVFEDFSAPVRHA